MDARGTPCSGVPAFVPLERRLCPPQGLFLPWEERQRHSRHTMGVGHTGHTGAMEAALDRGPPLLVPGCRTAAAI